MQECKVVVMTYLILFSDLKKMHSNSQCMQLLSFDMLMNSFAKRHQLICRWSHTSIIFEAKENDDRVDVSLNTGIRRLRAEDQARKMYNHHLIVTAQW